MNSNGFHVDELFQKCLFEEDEKEMVLSAIRTVQPNYQLPPPPSPEICKSSLLQDFYSRVSHSAQGGVEAGQMVFTRVLWYSPGKG